MARSEAAERPDPQSGREAGPRYAEMYAASHGDQAALDYRSSYVDTLIIDALFSNYRLLEAGCGTGGYLRLAAKAREIVGVDFSATMIAEARRFGITNARFECGRFETYLDEKPFDVVNIGGVIGWYAPWVGNGDVLRRAAKMIAPNGIVVATYVPPRTIIAKIKCIVARGHTVVTWPSTFAAIADNAGLAPLFSLDRGNRVTIFLRRKEHHG